MHSTIPRSSGCPSPSYYDATRRVSLPSTPMLEGSYQADVCIIGGGITGCSAALHLAERGFEVILLEAQEIGHGGSGRSGGQIITGIGAEMAQVEATLGIESARRIWELSREAVALTERLIERHSIPCDYRKGYLHVANKPRHALKKRALIERMALHYDYHALTWLDRDALREQLVTDAYVGGVHDPESGHLHPLNYTLGLARAALLAGASLHTSSRVIKVGDKGADGRSRVSTPRGSVAARFVVQATNAYSSALMPKLDAKLMPVTSHIVATAPLSEAQVAATLPSDAAVSDAMFMLDYYRLSADQRLLFGGRQSAASARQRIDRLFPCLAGIELEYYWNGLVAITSDQTPHFGRIGDNFYFAQGYSGHGMALSGLAGKLIGEAIAGQAERFDLFARFDPRSFPGGVLLRRPLLELATRYYKMRDML
ncbi:NAD(P)/FAD-dependent oxidoreductase [Halotalea alkalilenta]|uniref:NAD(P)/FAD-dependent oxidoreductase n=1 Tax=Halotalea alkalilenta TaxID=376489 RepID=UPI0005BB8FDF|nr:FAD-binding oxidoreductase [Halotalea alkalilenta]